MEPPRKRGAYVRRRPGTNLKTYQFQLTDDQRAAIERLADLWGLSLSGALRAILAPYVQKDADATIIKETP